MSQKKCSTEVFSRVTGFFRPVQAWNKGKVEEFKDRQKFNLDSAFREEKQCEDSRVTEAVSG